MGLSSENLCYNNNDQHDHNYDYKYPRVDTRTKDISNQFTAGDRKDHKNEAKKR